MSEGKGPGMLFGLLLMFVCAPALTLFLFVVAGVGGGFLLDYLVTVVLPVPLHIAGIVLMLCLLAFEVGVLWAFKKELEEMVFGIGLALILPNWMVYMIVGGLTGLPSIDAEGMFSGQVFFFIALPVLLATVGTFLARRRKEGPGQAGPPTTGALAVHSAVLLLVGTVLAVGEFQQMPMYRMWFLSVFPLVSGLLLALVAAITHLGSLRRDEDEPTAPVTRDAGLMVEQQSYADVRSYVAASAQRSDESRKA